MSRHKELRRLRESSWKGKPVDGIAKLCPSCPSNLFAERVVIFSLGKTRCKSCESEARDDFRPAREM